jgi:protein-tyrosine sulfotransferase
MYKKLALIMKNPIFVLFFMFFCLYALFSIYFKNKSDDKILHNTPLIFIGGSYRSGTTLMRVMLDAHPLIRCGQETRILPRFLDFIQRQKLTDSVKLEQAGISKASLDKATRTFISNIIYSQGKIAQNICTKDPETLKHIELLAQLYTNSKFILMIRDARATIYSVMKKNLSAGQYSQDYSKNFIIWNRFIHNMYSQCTRVGKTRCLPVFYEQLVLFPEKEMRKILKFLNIPWNESVLKHEVQIGKKISTSIFEISTDQVTKGINLEGLNNWAGNIPEDILKSLDELAPMLKILGYDTKANPPDYKSFHKNLI